MVSGSVRGECLAASVRSRDLSAPQSGFQSWSPSHETEIFLAPGPSPPSTTSPVKPAHRLPSRPALSVASKESPLFFKTSRRRLPSMVSRPATVHALGILSSCPSSPPSRQRPLVLYNTASWILIANSRLLHSLLRLTRSPKMS